MKRTVLMGAVLALVLSLPVHGAEKREFVDVKEGDWFAPYVETCVEAGLMRGTEEGRFEPERELTDPECLTLALRLYDLQGGGSGELKAAPEDWRPELTGWWRDACYTYFALEDSGVQDALQALEGFLKEEDIAAAALVPTTRYNFAGALSGVAGALEPINEVEDLPDTKDWAVLRLYRAGILTGIDEEGTFNGTGKLTRAECAAMVARVVDPALRIRAILPADSFVPFEEGGLYGLKGGGGKVHIPAQYAYLVVEEDGSVVVTDREGNKGILDTDGNVIVPCLYPRIYNSPDEEGLVVVGTAGDFPGPLHYNGKKGMIDTRGTIVIPLEYDFLTPFENGQASFLRGEVYGHLLPDGTEVPLSAEEISKEDPLYVLIMFGIIK